MAKKPPPIKQPGAEKRLCHLTYSRIAEWAGLAPRSVIQYASRGDFDPNNLESVLQWANARRQAKGLPLIGAPPGNSPENFQEISESQAPEAPTGGQATKNPRENQPETPETDSQKLSVHQPYLAPPQQYNPLTGDYSP